MAQRYHYLTTKNNIKVAWQLLLKQRSISAIKPVAIVAPAVLITTTAMVTIAIPFSVDISNTRPQSGLDFLRPFH